MTGSDDFWSDLPLAVFRVKYLDKKGSRSPAVLSCVLWDAKFFRKRFLFSIDVVLVILGVLQVELQPGLHPDAQPRPPLNHTNIKNPRVPFA